MESIVPVPNAKPALPHWIFQRVSLPPGVHEKSALPPVILDAAKLVGATHEGMSS